MPRNYSRAKSRAKQGRFALLPHQCLEHTNYTRLTPKAIKLFVDLLYQYNGGNNGDLTAAFTIMKKRGWKSKETIFLALGELLHYGWIMRTRTGGLNRTPHLYAVTLHPIDECGGKLDERSTTTAPGNWKQDVDDWVKPANYRARLARRQKKSLVREPYLVGTVPVSLKQKTNEY